MMWTKLTVRCKAFSCEGVRVNRVAVSDKGEVKVWDNVAGHYTTCHSLTPVTIRRIKKLSASK